MPTCSARLRRRPSVAGYGTSGARRRCPAGTPPAAPARRGRAAGAIVRVTGITGNIRGAIHTRATGESIRPSLVIIDDPQTDQSARSPSQCAQRESVISGAVLNLAGPGRKIAGLMTLTVVVPGDMADRILDRDRHPQWQGERTRMVYAFPANERLWAEYARIRADSLRNDGDGHEATAFYIAHREEMDRGAVVAWPARHNPDEVSAVQHAMNLKLQDEAAFFAEYQNEPIPESQGDGGMLAAEQIAAKVSGLRRGEVPVGANHLTAFVDVQGAVLYWMVCGWEDDFTGAVLDYGTYPDQRRGYFTLKDARRTLQLAHRGAGQEAAIYAGLETLTADLLRRHPVHDGSRRVKGMRGGAQLGSTDATKLLRTARGSDSVRI